MAAYNNETLFQNLKNLNVIEETKLKTAFEKSKHNAVSLETVLLQDELIADESLGKVIADIINFPFIRLTSINIPKEIISLVPRNYAKKHRVIPFSKDKVNYNVAFYDPQNIDLIQQLEKKVGRKIKVFYATEKDINDSLNAYQESFQDAFTQMLRASSEKQPSDGKKITDPSQITGDNISVENIVDFLLHYAYYNKASDIHIEPTDNLSTIRFRIDGILHDMLKIPNNLHDQIVSRIKVLSKLRTDEHMQAQDGKMQEQMDEELLDIRVSIVPIVEGEKAVLRLLSSKSRDYNLPELGMTDADLAKVKNAYHKPYGMLLSTGPTGSGKTTSIYAIIKNLNTRDINIATIEDPVEYDMPGINQIQVNTNTNLTFADGLRAILRQDPNVIFVGEIRDKETAGIAVNSAMTGHLVLSTLHTNDAATTLPRLIEMNIEPFLVASTVNVIIAQRLVRRICANCKVPAEVELKELRAQIGTALVDKHLGIGEKANVFKGKGCDICHSSGFINRTGLFEVLEITQAIRELINQKADATAIERKAIEEGMTTMLEDGLLKIANGLTTIEEVMREVRS